MTALRGGMRATAAALNVGCGVVAASPALAASNVSKGEASALRLGVAGTDAYSGAYTATNDGKGETTTGNSAPAITVLGTSSLISQGTLNQDAKTGVSGRTLSSAACAGLSGEGATLVAVGSTNCLTPGKDTASLNVGTLDLSNLGDAVTVAGVGSILDQLGLAALLNQTGAQLTTALKQALTALGSPAVTLDAGVIQGQCTATQGAVSGSAQLVGAGLNVDLGSAGQALGIDPVSIGLPSNPAPNTKVVTNLDAVTKEITDGLTTSLSQQTGVLGSILVPLGVTAAQLSDLANMVVDQISGQLGPLEQNLLDITLNKQTRTGDSQIHVTALDAQVLPAAQQAIGASLVSAQIGDVDCLGGTAAAVTTPPSNGGNVPTSVDAGLSGEQGMPTGVMVALGALFLVAAGGVGVRQVKLHRSQG